MEERKSFHASMASLGPPNSQFGGGGPPMLLHNGGGGGRLVVGENGTPGRLPTRREVHNNGKKTSPLPPTEDKAFGSCSGPFVVLWIILGIVTFGVLLGIVLKFTVST